MATKDITDRQVCEAYAQMRDVDPSWPFCKEFADVILMRITGQPEKVCYRAMERAVRRGLVEYGVTMRSGWLTEAGKVLLG